MAKLRFALIEDGYTTPLHPIYKELKIKYKKESGGEYFRTELEGKVKFVKDDYDTILSRSFDTVYKGLIYVTKRDKTEKFISFKFRRTDCKIDADNGIIETKLTAVDGYDDLINGLDKEFDLIELAPAIEQVHLHKRPAIQIYKLGEKVVGSFIEGVYWEDSCDPITDVGELNRTHGFGRVVYRYISRVYGAPLSKYPFITIENSTTGDDWNYYSSDKRLRVWYQQTTEFSINSVEYRPTESDPWEKCSYEGPGKIPNTSLYSIPVSSGMVAPIFAVDNSPTSYGYVCRILHDNPNAEGGASKIDISKTNGFKNSTNYKYATPYDIEEAMIQFHGETTKEPTKYGQRQPGEYYKKIPAPMSQNKHFMPLLSSIWGDWSMWVNTDVFTPPSFELDKRYRLPITLKHAYTVQACIEAILKKIAPDITFKADRQHSEFFYGLAMGTDTTNKLFITQKTNILKGEYDQPAQKMPITLKKILDMLRNCFKCYWFIDDAKRLRIEHIRFFMSGLSYLPVDTQPYIDTTQAYSLPNNKAWSFATNSFEYNFEDMPEQFQFKWADDCSKPFSGMPIKIVSNYVKKGQIENISISDFSSDIDMMLLRPDMFNKDGNAVLLADNRDNTLRYDISPIVPNYNPIAMADNEVKSQESADGWEYFNPQNPIMSLFWLVRKFWCYDLPGSKAFINNMYVAPDSSYLSYVSGLGVKRAKKQKLKYPESLDISPYNLVKTNLGIGQIAEMSVDLSSEVAEITVLHDTEK